MGKVPILAYMNMHNIGICIVLGTRLQTCAEYQTIALQRLTVSELNQSSLHVEKPHIMQ